MALVAERARTLPCREACRVCVRAANITAAADKFRTNKINEQSSTSDIDTSATLNYKGKVARVVTMFIL